MRNLPLLATAAALAALTAVTGCEPGTGAAQPADTPVTATASEPAATPLDAVNATATQTATAPETDSAADAVAAAVAATRSVTAAYVRYSAVGFETLTATSWAADVTTVPPTARGNADLLVDGRRVPTGFVVDAGRLTIENADGSYSDVGDARSVLDPPRILDAVTGLAATLASLTDVSTDSGPAELNDVPMVRVRGQLDPADARLLLPDDALTGVGELPVTLWLDPAVELVARQMVVTVGDGAVIISVDPTHR